MSSHCVSAHRLSLVLLACVACSPVLAPNPEPDPLAATSGGLRLATVTGDPCIDPEEPSLPPSDFRTTSPRPAVPPATVLDGGMLSLQATGSSSGALRVASRVAVEGDSRSLIELQRGPLMVRVSIQPGPSTPGSVWLRAPTLPLSQYDLATTYRVTSTGQLLVTGLELVNGTTGAPVDTAPAAGSVAAAPGNCEETALVRFGPIPFGMPSFKWPENDFCSGEQCVQVRLAYVHAVHSTWRTTQIMDIVASYPHSAQRSWAWGRVGMDQDLNPLSERTSPKHWFGAFTPERFAIIRELYQDHLNVLRSAEMDGRDLHLRCPSGGQHGCTGSYWAHHVVKGYVNLCSELWDDVEGGTESDLRTYVDHTVGHELYHHHYVNIPGMGWKMVKDKLIHKHNSACSSLSFEKHYVDWSRRFSDYDHRLVHLASYENSDGETCGHREVALRNVDTYNTFAWLVGRMVYKKDFYYWPQPADPTPQPPSCHSSPGCLCDEAGPHDVPDGDFRSDQFCPDDEGDVVCVKTTFNASSTVGICKRCSDERGPGCACNDFTAPCDVGTCWGDDTGGLNSSVGQCYVGTPPQWACLADCDALFNHGECMLESMAFGHRALCVPGTAGPDVANCYEYTGHIDPQSLECTDEPQCDGATTCQSLGYPAYFTCDYGGRCVADVD